MFRIEAKDADALGLEVQSKPRPPQRAGRHAGAIGETGVGFAQDVFRSRKSVNIVDLGLIYDCHLTPIGANNYKAT